MKPLSTRSATLIAAAAFFAAVCAAWLFGSDDDADAPPVVEVASRTDVHSGQASAACGHIGVARCARPRAAAASRAGRSSEYFCHQELGTATPAPGVPVGPAPASGPAAAVQLHGDDDGGFRQGHLLPCPG